MPEHIGTCGKCGKAAKYVNIGSTMSIWVHAETGDHMSSEPERHDVNTHIQRGKLMDPNEALRQIRLLIKQMRVEDAPISGVARPEFVQHARDLAEQVEALDEWLDKGGFPPDAWTPAEPLTTP